MESEFVKNPLMALAGLVLIPVIIWFLKQKQTKTTILFGILFLLVFSGGTLELIGLPTSIHRLLLELLALWVFYKGVIIKTKKPKQLPGILWLVMFILFSILSVVLNNISVPLLLLFLRDYLMVFLFFYGVYNLYFSPYETNTIKKLIIYLFISQIFANVIKVLINQTIMEPYIGTMANLGGSLTVLFALFGSSYALSNYLIFKRKKYIYLILGFLIFSILGAKRSTIVYFPLIFVILTFLYHKKFERINFRLINRIMIFSVLSIFAFYFAVRLMPSLNKERVVWGSFDIEYALDYSERYVTTGAGAIDEVGRAEAPVFILTNMINDDIYSMLFGYGAGHLVKSNFNDLLVSQGSQQNLTENLYGVGYGARTGLIQIVLQVGIAGLLAYLLLLYFIFKKSLVNINSLLYGNQLKLHYLFLIAIWLVLSLDFFTYSVVSAKISSLSLSFFLYLGLIGNKSIKFLK